MIKKESLDQPLDDVHQIVAAADVRQLVRQDGFELLRGEGQDGGG
jgi:hypothetical protein